MPSKLQVLQDEIVACRRCPRLIEHCQNIARVRKRAYRDWEYWGRPVPSFGDPRAQILIIGLAPAAHGANRTGRVFTGDSSGNFLYQVLHATGFASQPHSVSRTDGQRLHGSYITAAAHCAPPGNKPTPQEFRNCRGYLERELDLLKDVRVVVALGKHAFDIYLSILRDRGSIQRLSAFRFAHNAQHITAPGLPVLLSSYHPSQQNTNTGKLTEAMFRAVFERARGLLDATTPGQTPRRTGPRSART
ncbi:MAG TPA: uracil-DNA glycosylase [Solibacterales bacterium]|nr:uracil-DNA glycosylase [Bryobacterales bacterium]